MDIERLKVDREYWDSVAPQGATHYIGDPSYQDGSDWEKRTDKDRKVWVSLDGKWRNIPWKPKLELQRIYKYFIPRPEPRQMEWDGEGLPPVGERCLGKHKEFNSNFECVINGYRDGKVWFTDFMDTSEREFVYPLSQVELRPIRTKEQREREELAECVAKAATLDAGIMLEEWQYDKIADAIIAAGWRKDQ